ATPHPHERDAHGGARRRWGPPVRRRAWRRGRSAAPRLRAL
ncbi:MAG: hypothetical protein AVDCRST_MAG79-1794, partial [uncultured Thermoleophilia bacterium]